MVLFLQVAHGYRQDHLMHVDEVIDELMEDDIMKLGIIYAGQGSQVVGMGKSFYPHEIAKDL